MFVKFRQDNFDENDERARTKAKELLSKRYTVIDNPDPYDIDLICYKDNKIICYVEVEVKNLWQGQEFPWNEVNVPRRKSKYFIKYKNSYYIMFNTDLTSCLIADRVTMLQSRIVEIPNKRNPEGEYFLKVPYEKMFHHKNI